MARLRRGAWGEVSKWMKLLHCKEDGKVSEDMEILPTLLIVAPFVAVLFFGRWMLRWQWRRADELLETWAKNHQYRIVEKRHANVGDGPAGTRQSSKRVKYKITVTDAQGQRKHGLISIGSVAMGTLHDDIAVEWDE